MSDTEDIDINVEQKPSKMKKIIKVFALIIIGAGIYMIFFMHKESSYNKNKAMDSAVKKLPINGTIKFKTQKSTEPSRVLNDMVVLDQDKFTIIMLELSAQTKFGAVRSVSGETYKVTLYNTKKSENFKTNISSQASDSLSVTTDEDDLILNFSLKSYASVTEIAFTDEYSSKLAIKLYIKDEEEKEQEQEINVRKLKNTKSPTELSQEYYQRSLDLANSGDISGAYNNAKKSIAHRQDNHQARKMFILSALELGRRNEAEQALEQGIYLAPNMTNYKKIKAKLLLGDNKPQQALETLLTNRPEMSSDGDYYAFIAAIRQKLGDHRRAIKLYAELLRLYPHEGEWWAGLGVSFDSIGNERQALRAFNKALDIGGLDADLQNYVEMRIDDLN